MDETRWLAGLESQARDRLPAPVFEHLVQGARDGLSAARAAGPPAG